VECHQRIHQQHSLSTEEYAMELLDRYLQAVRKHLPWKRQDDIIAELRANLESQLEEREAELGRPLNQSEAEDWIKKLGPPIQMAARYQPQQYLIGPGLFPTYWYVLRLVFFWAVAIYLVVAGVQLVFQPTVSSKAALEVVLRIPGVIINSAAWVTVIFAAIELVARYCPEKLPNELSSFSPSWSPSSLPPLEKDAARGVKRRSYVQAVAEVVFGFLFLIWLLLIPRHPFLLFGPGAFFLEASQFQLAPVWIEWYWLMVALCMLQLLWHGVDLLRGKWQKPNLAQLVMSKVVGLVSLGLLVTAPGHVLVYLKHPEVDQARYGETVTSINRGIHVALMVAGVVVVLQIFAHLLQIGVAAYRKRVVSER
jgi:hypothetical protein